MRGGLCLVTADHYLNSKKGNEAKCKISKEKCTFYVSFDLGVIADKNMDEMKRFFIFSWSSICVFKQCQREKLKLTTWRKGGFGEGENKVASGWRKLSTLLFLSLEAQLQRLNSWDWKRKMYINKKTKRKALQVCIWFRLVRGSFTVYFSRLRLEKF